MLRTRLELRGDFEVLAAEDSEAGCRLAATEPPDVILMDLEMPDDDRWEAVRRAAADSGCTTSTAGGAQDQARKSGTSDGTRHRNAGNGSVRSCPEEKRRGSDCRRVWEP